jgi:hypothetical protein
MIMRHCDRGHAVVRRSFVATLPFSPLIPHAGDLNRDEEERGHEEREEEDVSLTCEAHKVFHHLFLFPVLRQPK